MKYYIATKLENYEAHNALRNKLAALGHEITYDWTSHNAVWGYGTERIREVADLEHRGVIAADTVIVLWPGGMGTHVELGIALGLEKNIVFISAHPKHHTASPEVCAFYLHENVERFCCVEDFLSSLDTVKTHA